MSAATRFGAPIKKLSYASTIIALAVITAMAISYERQAQKTQHQNDRVEVQKTLSQLRSNLENRMSGNIQLVQGLIGLIEYKPSMTQAEFTALVGIIEEEGNQIRLIAAAPNLINKLIHPIEGYEDILGMNYRSYPEHLQAILKSRELDRAIVTGPFDLEQSGLGIIVRHPVFVEDILGSRRYWGLVSTVIDARAFFEESGLLDPNLSLEIALVGRNGDPTNNEVLFGNPDVAAENPVVSEVALPHGAWRIAATPKGGWSAPEAKWDIRGIFAAAALLIVGPIIGTAHLLAARQRDHLDLRRMEKERARLSERLEIALTASEVGVWDADLITGKTIWDKRARTIYRKSGDSEVTDASDFESIVHPDDLTRVKEEIDEAVRTDKPLQIVYRLRFDDGEIRHIRSIAAVTKENGKPIRLVGVAMDITEEVYRTEELDARRLEAEAATRAKSEFLATMSHEIRTPMSGILGMLDLVLGSSLDSLQRERTNIALESAKSLLQILNDILDFSKFEAKEIVLDRDSVDVRSLTSDVVALMTAAADKKGLDLSFDVASSVPEWIIADQIRYRQILTNLVSNAIKFTDSGSISISVEYSDGELGCSVTDTGIGIEADKLDNVFGKFVQADSSSSRRSGGTGLGLAISQQLTELMGGRISAKSVINEGSTFAFTIRTTEAEAPTNVSTGGGEDTLPEETSLNILVAEDNSTNQYLIEAFLKAANHTCTIVENGALAVAAVESGGFDVVLMDIQMPEMDGPTATRAIRNLDGPVSEIPIIALTANVIPEDRETYITAGMNDYLSKPIDVDELKAALKRTSKPVGTAGQQTVAFDETPQNGNQLPPDEVDNSFENVRRAAG